MKPVRICSGDYYKMVLIKSFLEFNGIISIVENEHMSLIAPWRVEPGGLSSAKIIVDETDADEASQLITRFNSDDTPD